MTGEKKKPFERYRLHLLHSRTGNATLTGDRAASATQPRPIILHMTPLPTEQSYRST